MIIVNGWKPLTIITKRSILDVAAVLDPPLIMTSIFNFYAGHLKGFDFAGNESYFRFRFIYSHS